MSNKKFLPFALPDIGDEEILEVVDTLKSGWVTTGPKAKIFENNFVEFLGDNTLEAIAVNSATSGLHLALESLGVGAGDEVIIPSYTFTATAEVVRYLGATPVFVDVCEKTFNISLKEVELAVTERTKVIIPVHFAGLSCDMDPLIKLARKHSIFIVEDAAHALPTFYKNSMIGTLQTDITVFSFYANKTMTTAEGGMLVTRNPALAQRCKIMRLHGISRDAFDRYVSTKPSWHYEVVAPGFKYNLPDICAALGIQQLKKLPNFLKKREQLADYYIKNLHGLPITLPSFPDNGNTHAWHLFPILLDSSLNISRNDFITKMSERGVGCSVHFIPLHLQPYWRDNFNLNPVDFPVSNSLYQRQVSLPLYTRMTIEDASFVVENVKAIISND